MNLAENSALQTVTPASINRCNNKPVALNSEHGWLPIAMGTSDTKAVCKYVYVVGPSSSGKSTLCHAFAEDAGIFPSAYIKEIARVVMRTHAFTRADVDTFEMQSAIMTAQLRAESEVIARIQEDISPAKSSPLLVLSDRSAVDPIVYTVSSTTLDAEERASRLLHDSDFQDALPRYRESLFILLTPVSEWIEDDGVRSLENPWRYCYYLRKTLRELGIPFREMGEETKDIHARVRIMRQWANLDGTEH